MVRLMEDVRDGKLDLRADEAGGRTAPRQRPRGADLAGSRHRSRRILLGFALVPPASCVGLLDVMAFGLALVLGGLMIYCFWLTITTVAFWVVRMENVLELFEGVYQAGKLAGRASTRPGSASASPSSSRSGSPSPCRPQAVTSRLEWQTLALAVGFAVFLFALTRWFLHFGLRRYSGASA